MKKGILIKQHDITDCGAACLASIAVHYGLKLPIAHIRQYAFADKKETDILELIEAVVKIGIDAKGVRAVIEGLKIIPKPTIAEVIVKDGLHHFVVVYKVTDKYADFMDPADGRMHRKSLEEFEKEWTGVLILIRPPKTFQTKSKLKRFIELLKQLWRRCTMY